MKKIGYFICTFIFIASVGICNINAKSVSIEDEDSLRNCLTTDGSTCELSMDIVLKDPIDIDGNVVLNLNGKKITRDTVFSNSYAPITVKNGGTLTINDADNSGEISGGNTEDVYGAIRLTMPGDDASKVAKLIVNGGHISGYYYAIVGNGNRDNTYVEINGGIIEGLNTEDSLGIYHPQYGELIINGGEIKGQTGIEMRGGKLTVNDGKISGLSNTFDVQPSGNGSTSIGAGIAANQHNTGKILQVVINGGTISGIVPVLEKNIQGNLPEATANISVRIEGGKFDVINGGTKSVDSEDSSHFISGGSYNIEPEDDYILLPYAKVKKADNRYYVELKTENKIEEIDPAKQTKDPQVGVTEEQKGALEEIIKETIKNNETIFDDVKGKEIEIVLEIDENKDVQGKESFENKLEKGAVSLGYFDIDINVYEKDTTNLLSTITETEDKIKLSVVVPNNLPELEEGYTRKFYIVREHNGEYELLEGSASKDGKSFEFESNKFSTFLLAYSDVKNPKTADSVISYIAYTLLGISLFGACVLYLNNVSKKKNI